MRNIVALAAIVGPLFSATLAWGQSYSPFSQWRIDASLPLQFGTNSLLAPTNAQSDVFVSPFLKLSALGNVNPTLTYSAYVSGGPDIFERVQTANDGSATAGAKFQQAFGDFAVGTIYEHVLVDDGVFRTLLFQANDYSGYVGYSYSNGAGLTVKPSFTATYRSADLASAQRFLYTLKAAFQQDLTKDLSLFLTPRLRYYEFTDGTSAGRRDTRPSIVGGLTYAVNKDVSVTSSVEYDQRSSNVTGKNFMNTVFLTSVDFGHTYDWWR